jgi:hypothetical protein
MSMTLIIKRQEIFVLYCIRRGLRIDNTVVSKMEIFFKKIKFQPRKMREMTTVQGRNKSSNIYLDKKVAVGARKYPKK